MQEEQFMNILQRQNNIRKTTERRKTKKEVRIEREELAKEEAKE